MLTSFSLFRHTVSPKVTTQETLNSNIYLMTKSNELYVPVMCLGVPDRVYVCVCVFVER